MLDFAKALKDDLSAGETRTAAKPGLPVLLPCALGMWACQASAYALLEHATAWEAGALSLAFAAFLAAALVASVATRKRLCVLAAFCIAGCALGCAASHAIHQATDAVAEGNAEIVLTAVSDERASEFGSWCSVECELEGAGRAKATAFFDSFSGLLVGDKAVCEARVRPVSEDYATRAYFAGECAQVDAGDIQPMRLAPPAQVLSDFRHGAIGVIAAHGGDEAGVLQALVCGYRGTIQSDGTYEHFKACGLAHVVAVSGAHLAIVTMTFGCALKALRIGRRIQVAASSVFVLAYLAFAGVPVSAVRAAAMVLVSLFAGAAGRRNATLNALAVCMVAFLVVDPISCVSVSLFLSAGSTLGIVLFASLVTSWMEGLPRRLHKAVAEPVGLTLSSNVVTMPYSAAAFGMVPILALPANVVATPLFTLGCLAGLAATLAGMLVPGAAGVLIGAASLAAAPLRAFVSWASSLPFASMEADLPVVPMVAFSCACAVALWLEWPRVRTAVFCSALSILAAAYVFVAFLMPPSASDSVTMLDVGQGDAILLSSQGKTLLVDTGNEDRMLRDALASAGVRHIDAVAVTHPDADHCASLGSLSTYTDIGSFVCAAPMLACACDKCAALVEEAKGIVGEKNVVAVNVGDVVEVGNFRIEVAWPAEYADEGGNADSLCLIARLDCDGDGEPDWRILLTGDAESEQLDAMAARGLLEDVDVLKVGHHGSKASLDAEALNLLRPEVALVSCGENNSYGHPAPQTVDALEGAGAKVLRTDEMGTVRLTFDEDKVNLPRQSK